jgi:hypothetical protein
MAALRMRTRGIRELEAISRAIRKPVRGKRFWDRMMMEIFSGLPGLDLLVAG